MDAHRMQTLISQQILTRNNIVAKELNKKRRDDSRRNVLDSRRNSAIELKRTESTLLS